MRQSHRVSSRCLGKGGSVRALTTLIRCIDKGLEVAREPLAEVANHVEVIRKIDGLLDPESGKAALRKSEFFALAENLNASADPIRAKMAEVMTSFADGLFVGDDDLPRDNLDLERFFRSPKGHERRIHGHAHAGIRIVLRGPTLIPTLDAHMRHPDPFSAEELSPYLDAPPPAALFDCRRRAQIMRRARSTKRRAALLAELESRMTAAFHARAS